MNQKKKVKNPVAFMGIGVFVIVMGTFLIFGIKSAIQNIGDSQKLKEYSQTTGTVVRT